MTNDVEENGESLLVGCHWFSDFIIKNYCTIERKKRLAGAIVDEGGGGGRRGIGEDGRGGTGNVPDVTPRQVTMNLPGAVVSARAGTIVAAHTAQRTRDNTATTPTRTTTRAHHRLHLHHHRGENDSGPYTDGVVLLDLQLLAYLSKYLHARQAFYKSRTTFHPASVNLTRRGGGGGRRLQR